MPAPSFRILQPLGPVPPFDPGNPGMVSDAGETTGDVELAYEIAPGANILLVQFPLTATTVDGDFAEAMTAENDVTQGDNTVSFTLNGTPVTVEGYPARPGYDLVTGVGTVAARLVPELAATDLGLTP